MWHGNWPATFVKVGGEYLDKLYGCQLGCILQIVTLLEVGRSFPFPEIERCCTWTLLLVGSRTCPEIGTLKVNARLVTCVQLVKSQMSARHVPKESLRNNCSRWMSMLGC